MALFISIIVPNYNHAPYLAQRLDSVFNQTYQNFEVILLDDASTDDSVAILKTYQNHPKVSHFIVNTTNSGSPFKQWQKGIALAKGDYVWIAESDDTCQLIFLEQLISICNKEITIAFCASNVMNESGLRVKKNDWAQQLTKEMMEQNFILKGTTVLKKYLRYRNIIPNASAAIFKKSCYEDAMLKTDFYFCGDWYFWCKMSQKGCIAYSSKYLNEFRRHEFSTRIHHQNKKEIKRFREYFFIITQYAHFWSRFLNFKKYRWIIEEITVKKLSGFLIKKHPSLLPFEFKLYFFAQRLKKSLKP